MTVELNETKLSTFYTTVMQSAKTPVLLRILLGFSDNFKPYANQAENTLDKSIFRGTCQLYCKEL